MNKYPPLVYLAAPYRARTPWQIEQNVQFAQRIGHFMMTNGVSPIITHVMYGSYIGGVITEQYIIETVKEIMRRCDAVYVAGMGWTASAGVKSEICEAKRLRIPVFYDMTTGHPSGHIGMKSMKEYFSKQKTFKMMRG